MADGMFAASLYDREEKILYLLRDRVGEKPLYYHADEKTGNFYFASELKPLARGIRNDLKIDETGLYLYLLLRYVPAPIHFKWFSKTSTWSLHAGKPFQVLRKNRYLTIHGILMHLKFLL